HSPLCSPSCPHLFYCVHLYTANRHLHSFPTRRSSDLSGIDSRVNPRRLAHRLRGPRALLHEGGMGDWRFRLGRRKSVRSSSLEALSHAAAAGEIFGSAL